MQAGIRNNAPSTYYIRFTKPVNNDYFSITDHKGRVYFYRYLPTGCTGIKVNIIDPGYYTLSEPAVVIRKPLQIANEVYRIKLPPRERHRDKDYFITHDDRLTASPAIIYTDIGHIITGVLFKKLPPPMRRFVLLHETGHFRYKTEKYCDLYAFTEAIKMGDNPSSCMYALTDMLKENPQNDERINYIYNKMLESELIK